MGSRYNIKIKWETGEVTWEPLNIIGTDDPVSCAIYAKKHGLLNKEGWKRFRRLAKREKKMVRMLNQAKLRSFRTSPRYKYGFQVPKNHDEAMALDEKNGNTKCKDVEQLELSVLDEHKTFTDFGKGKAPPVGYKCIKVWMIYDIKHNGRHKA